MKRLLLWWDPFFLRAYQWYRRMYGGRWERHWIGICGSYIWLPMHPDRKWPDYRQPCSDGTPTIEDYPQRGC
jgi:hypothetical protein